jgi:hypothetical protein
LNAPHENGHVDDDVFRVGQTAEPVGDGEGPPLVRRLVVPDDPQPVLDPYGPEGARRAVASKLGVAARAVTRRALRNLDVVDRLAATKRDVAVGAGERTGELERDQLADEQRRIRIDPDVDRRGRERVRLGECAERSDERSDRQREEDPEAAAQLEN